LLLAVRSALDSAATAVADPVGENGFAFERLMFSHHITQRAPHAIDLATKEIEIARPPEILRAAANEILGVDVVPRVVLRKERLDRHAARRGVAKAYAQLRNFTGPLWMAIHGDHRVADDVAF